MTYRIGRLTALTLIAFGSNSILCRMALSDGSIDAASFTLVRLGSGAIGLCILNAILSRKFVWNSGGSWISGCLLFAYAAGFSFAYLSLSAGTGGLILFGCVQLSMIGWGLWKGERPKAMEWIGLVVALSGLVVLVLPGLHAPSPLGAVLMASAGLSWGLYSIRGRGVLYPAQATGDNFLRSVPFAALVMACAIPGFHASAKGIGWAVVSGAITSGLGYVLWYSVLPHLSATRAAIAQLAVPALVAVGGVLFLSEPVTWRLMVSAVLMLGGVAIAVLGRRTA